MADQARASGNCSNLLVRSYRRHQQFSDTNVRKIPIVESIAAALEFARYFCMSDALVIGITTTPQEKTMPIKTDGAEKRWVEMEFLTPGTSEQVWQVMATGPGNAAWFTRGEIEGRIGGRFMLDFGHGMTSSGEVTAWDPPHHFGYVERDWAEGAPPVATDITITPRSDGQCLVRMVHSLSTSSNAWDDQIEGFEQGWPGFFEVLRVYLTNFAGMEAASFMVVEKTNGDHLSVWRDVAEQAGIFAANVGEHRSGSFGPERWSGLIGYVHQDSKQRYVLFRLEQPTQGIAMLGTYETKAGINVSANCYFYGADAIEIATTREPKMREWLKQVVGIKNP